VDAHGTDLLAVVEEGIVEAWSDVRKPARPTSGPSSASSAAAAAKEPTATFEIVVEEDGEEKSKGEEERGSQRQTIQAAGFVVTGGKGIDIRAARNITAKPVLDLLVWHPSKRWSEIFEFSTMLLGNC
jgi:electron transfer flavoprotein alpha subunit